MAVRYQVPGVYYEPLPREPEPPFVRTDVAGFIGFEPRFSESQPPSLLTGSPAAALIAIAAAANAAVVAVTDAENSAAAILAAGIFGPVVPQLAEAANTAAHNAAEAALRFINAAAAAITVSLKSARGPLAEAVQAAAAAALSAAQATNASDASTAATAATAARARATAVASDVDAALAAASNALTAGANASQAAAYALSAATAVLEAGKFPPVDPERATAITASSAALTAAAAMRTSAALTFTEEVAAAATPLETAVTDAGGAAAEAACAGNRLAATVATETCRAAAESAHRRAEAVASAVVDAGHSPMVGHDFRVDVASFQVAIGGERRRVVARRGFVLSKDGASIPIKDGESIIYALAAVDRERELELRSIVGAAALPGETARRPSNSEIDAALATPAGPPTWVRLADILVARAGQRIRQIVRPSLSLTRCDDWSDFVLAMGTPPDDGTFLTHAVRGFFANGGRRCYVASVSRPAFDDPAGLEEARREMTGVSGDSEETVTGLERLLLVEDVMIVDAPDLYARHLAVKRRQTSLPPRDIDQCFRSCKEIVNQPPLAEAAGARDTGDPVYTTEDVRETQRRLLERCIPERWRVLLLLAPPLALDPGDGQYHGPNARQVLEWRNDLLRAVAAEDLELSCAAMYFPWVLVQECTGAPELELPPTPFAAGVIARRDLLRGPQVAPANETLRGVVGLTQAVDDPLQAELYEPPLNINVLRAFPGYGVQVWGACTLSPEKYMRYLPIRRCLSAIERRVYAALRELVFEPNTPLLWMQVTHAVLGVLMPLFDAGALRGSKPDEAFYVRCDASINPPEEVKTGRLVCEVGVAIAAPAEFIIFRLGRREGVVEVTE